MFKIFTEKKRARISLILFLGLFVLFQWGYGQCLETIEVSGSEVIYVFRCDGQFVMPLGFEEVEVLIVAGGGGGGYGNSAGGGGGGGVVYLESMSLEEGTSYPVQVGKGGAGAIQSNERGENGSNSVLNGYEAIGGGGGGSNSTDQAKRQGKNGGSGGGNARFANQNSSNAVPGQGNAGGGYANLNNNENSPAAGGGGGGAQSPGENGGNQGNSSSGGNGGKGKEFSVLSQLEFDRVAGGGGGTAFPGQGENQGIGGSGIGGDGKSDIGGNGVPNTGSGGGAGWNGGGKGADGIVVIRAVFRILPVIWDDISVNHHSESRTNILKWAINKEWESSHFEIERSIGGIDKFERIGEVASSGWSGKVNHYQFKDEALSQLGGWVYYRIKQIDLDGSFEYSDTFSVKVPISNSGKDVWKIYPNPFQGNDLKVALMDGEAYHGEEIRVNIVSAANSIAPFVVKEKDKLSQRTYEILSSANPGIYIVQLQWDDQVQNLKVLKR